MFDSLSRKTARRSIFVGAVALTATVLTSGPAVADTPVDSYLNWTVVFPIVGRVGPVTTEIETTLPGSVPEGAPSSGAAMTINTTLPPLCSAVFWQTIPNPTSYGNEADISGSAQVTVAATDSAGEQYSDVLSLTIPTTEVLLNDNGWLPITFPADGAATLPAMAHTGPATIRISAMALTLDARTLDGKDGVLGTRTYPLVLSSTGPTQNPTNGTALGTVEVGS